MERSQNMENDKTYLLNIQQQVRKNQIEIELLKSGIKIVGAGETLPASANEGDCYLLGTDNDYALNAYINGNWIPLGSFPAVGPQGVPGVKGDPAVISYITCAARAIDYGLAPHVSASVNGETVSFDFELPGGPRGLQGPKGEKGDKGDQGNVGPQGPQGEPGNSIRLFQNPSVVTASDLPAASVVGAGVGYLVGTYGTGYELYVTANDPLEWVDAGPFIPTQVTVDPKLDRLSENAVENKPVAKAIGMPATFSVTAAVAQGLILTDHFDDIYTNGYPFSAVDGGTRQKYLSFRESVGGGGTGRSYDYVSFSYNIYGLSVSSAMVVASSVGLTDSASVSAVDNFVVPKRSELVAAKNSLNAEIARSNAADNLHQKEITLLKNLVYDTVAASFSYSADYVHWMDIPASVEVSGSYHEVLDDAAAQIEAIEGTSVACNQLLNETRTQESKGITCSISGNTVSITGTSTETGTGPYFTWTDFALPIGHKVLVVKDFDFPSGLWLMDQYNGRGYADVTEAITTVTSGFMVLQLYISEANVSVNIQNKHIGIIDLTKAFPTDTPTTMDDPRIQAILSSPVSEYDAGSIKSSIVDKVISHGFNLWDEDWEPGALTNQGEPVNSTNNIRSKNFNEALPNTTYYFGYSKVIRVCWYNANHGFIGVNEASTGGGEVTSPAGTRYFKICTLLGGEPTYAHNICVSKSNVSLNGLYKPWVAPMSVDLAALGVALSKRTLLSARTARDRIYAVMQPDETYQLRLTRKVGRLNLGEPNWAYDANGVFYTTGTFIQFPSNNETNANIMCSKYKTTNYSNQSDKSVWTAWVGASVDYLYARDTNYNDATAFKAAMSGVYLVYELAAPTDELIAEGLTFGDLVLLIEKGGYLSIDGDGDYYGAIPGLTVDLPILRYE